MSRRTVIVLGGGPDAEREVSLKSSSAVAAALEKTGRYDVSYQVIDRPTADQLKAMKGDVFAPILHGGFGEGGPLQDLLAHDGRPYVGCGATAARAAMDKIATKMAALKSGIPTAQSAVFDARDAVCPIGLPVVLKPVHEGSSVGVHLCHNQTKWDAARVKAAADMREHPGRVYFIERLVRGAELTVGVMDPLGPTTRVLPPIRIEPAVEFYDYEAKYNRSDTNYTVDPKLPPGVKEQIQAWSVGLARGLGIRHLCRVDFLLDDNAQAWLLEVNTMPGFTDHSLFPMAAAKVGMDMPTLCAALVEFALRDGT